MTSRPPPPPLRLLLALVAAVLAFAAGPFAVRGVEGGVRPPGHVLAPSPHASAQAGRIGDPAHPAAPQRLLSPGSAAVKAPRRQGSAGGHTPPRLSVSHQLQPAAGDPLRPLLPAPPPHDLSRSLAAARDGTLSSASNGVPPPSVA